MGTDISRKQGETYLNEDQRWLKGGQLYAPADSILLDLTAFDLDATFPDGFIPSGIALGRVTATGLLAPYDPDAVNGSETAVGRLFTTVAYNRDSDADEIGGSLAVRCDVIRNYLPAQDTADAAAEEELVHMRHFTYNDATAGA